MRALSVPKPYKWPSAMTYKDQKIKSCIRLAREASRDSWQRAVKGSALMKALRRVKKEAMQDARYWRTQ